VYLKDHSPYPDSSLFIVNLRIQLELIYWATTPPVVITLLICSYLHTQPNNRTHRSSCYKVPLHLTLKKVLQFKAPVLVFGTDKQDLLLPLKLAQEQGSLFNLTAKLSNITSTANNNPMESKFISFFFLLSY